MKSRLKAASMLLLFALMFSFVPAATLPASVSAAQACTDRAQFLADVTVPDGTRFDPNAAFKKTWRLKNIGTCTWTTSYSMVFDTGTQMGSTTSVALPNSVAPGGSIDLSVDMTAPNAAGHYISYWKFKNAAGVTFGIGYYANKSWWVEINVTGSSQGGVAYDFTAKAVEGKATWSSGAGGLTFPGTDGDAKGFAQRLDRPNFESGVTASQPGLLFSPQQITNGFIQARFEDFPVQSGDRFQTTVGCQAGATNCYVAYRLDYELGGTIRTFWTFRERFEGLTYSPNLDLSPLAGQTVKFILYVSAWGSPVGDRALWGNPVIVRKGATPPTPITGTPPTATSTFTPGPVTVTVAPSTCDRAQFVRDWTVPDGTLMAPGQQFTKTWEIRNVGNCPWSKSYQIVYFSGEKMGSTLSFAFAEDVPVGRSAKFSINLTAPSAAGSYRGYWMFKNANGVLFGIGSQANKPWWVDIRVSGATVTPGGPTVTPTPTGPSPTPGANTAFDFVARACDATWYSLSGQLTCSSATDEGKGFVLKVNNPKLENGTTDPRPGLLTFPSPPKPGQAGYIQGFYPPFRVQTGDRFRSIINCEGGAKYCYVAFRLDYEVGGKIITLRGPFLERYEGQYLSLDEDLSSLAGKDVRFILTVLAAGVNTGDRALWVAPIIYRAGASPATAAATTAITPGTATSTATATVTGTVAATGTATATATTSSTSNLYQNTKYNFKFTLPAGATIVNQEDNRGEVGLPLVQTGTNLSDKTLRVSVTEGKNPCLATDMEGGGTTENVTINGIAFTKQSGQGVAAGNRYDWTAYSTTNGNACIIMQFILHSTNPGNWPVPPPEYDMAAESAVIGTVMETYNKINP